MKGNANLISKSNLGQKKNRGQLLRNKTQKTVDIFDNNKLQKVHDPLE